MFNNKRYKFSQTDEEQTEVLDPAQQNEIDFRDFVGKLKYYRLGDFNDERSISLARILFPYYKQNPEHENLTHIGFAILAFPENLPESSVLNLYNFIKRFPKDDLQDNFLIYSIKKAFPYIENGSVNFDNLDVRFQRHILTRFTRYFEDDKVNLLAELLTLPIDTSRAIISANPALLERFLLFNQKFPEYTDLAASNDNVFANYFELFFNNPDLINNFNAINFIFKVNGTNTSIKYLVKWGESFDISDLSPNELHNFALSIKLSQEDAINISPDEIKEIVKNPKVFDYLKDFADKNYEILDTIYFIKKISGENFSEFVRKINLDISADKYESPNAKKIQKVRAVYDITLSTLPFEFAKNEAYLKPTQLLWLANVPRESLENLSKSKRDVGFCSYMDTQSLNGLLTEFQYKYLGLLPYDTLRDLKQIPSPLTNENLQTNLEDNFREHRSEAKIPNEAYLDEMREFVQLSGLEITDPKIIYYYYLNKFKFARIDVEEYYEAMNKLNKMYPSDKFSKNEYRESTADYKVFPYIIAIFGTDIPNNLEEAFDLDTLAWDFYDLKNSIAVTDNKFLKMLGRYINKNINRISYFELNRLIHNVRKIPLAAGGSDSIENTLWITSEDEIIDILPQKLLFILESFPDISAGYLNGTFNKFESIYRNVDQNSELYRKMILLLSKNPFVMGSSPKAFEYVFNLLPNFSNENMKNAAKIIAMFNKKSELWIKKYETIHDAAQIIPNIISQKLKTKGSDFALRSNLPSAKLSTILEDFDNIPDEDLSLPEIELYNKVFIANVKRNIGDREIRDDDFLIEFSSHGLKVDSFEIVNYDEDQGYHDNYGDDDDDEENEIQLENINYSKLENLYISSLSIPLPEWAQDAIFSATYNNKELVGYFLPRNDTRGMFIGKYTGCCQHPTGEAWTSSIAGQISENACFFVVENPKNKEIVCQSFTWQDFGTEGGYSYGDEKVVFDNVEAVGIGNRMDAVVEIYKKAAEHIAKFGYIVILGTGASDIDLNRFGTDYQGSVNPNSLKEDFSHLVNLHTDIYTDANYAKLLAEPEAEIEEE